MRVLHFITRMILGGAQENTLYTVLGLAKIPGVTVKLVSGPAVGPEGELIEHGRAHGADIEIIPQLGREIHLTRDLSALLAMRRCIQAFRPDVVHTHSSKAGILGRTAAWWNRVPLIVHTIHGLPFHPFEKPLRNALYIQAERMAARLSDLIITVADAMTIQALAADVGRPEQFSTIYSGMDVRSFTECTAQRDAVRREFGVPVDRVVITKIARLFAFKGHDDVLDAAPAVLAAIPDVHFLFVGDGIWRERLEDKVRRHGLGEHVTFAGLVPAARIPEIMRASDMVVHASYREGLPRVAPQALLSERPVVCYDVDGAREVCRHGQTGLLVPAGDVDALAASLIRLAGDPALRRRMGARGREACERLFTVERMVERIYAQYQRLLPASEKIQRQNR